MDQETVSNPDKKARHFTLIAASAPDKKGLPTGQAGSTFHPSGSLGDPKTMWSWNLIHSRIPAFLWQLGRAAGSSTRIL